MCLQNGGVTMVLIFANAIMCCLSSGSSFILWGKAIFPHWFRNISTGLHLGYRTLQCMVSCFAFVIPILIWGRGDSRQVAERGHCSNSACKTGWWTCCAPWMNNFKYVACAICVLDFAWGVSSRQTCSEAKGIYICQSGSYEIMHVEESQSRVPTFCWKFVDSLQIELFVSFCAQQFVGCKKRLAHDVVQDFCKLSAIVLLLLIVAARLSTGGNWPRSPSMEGKTKVPSVTWRVNRGPMRIHFFLCFWIICLLLRLDHLCLDHARYCNPLHISTYEDEDYVGKIKKLAMRSTPQNLGYQCLQRYAAYTCCRWLRQMGDVV